VSNKTQLEASVIAFLGKKTNKIRKKEIEFKNLKFTNLTLGWFFVDKASLYYVHFCGKNRI
jgi:hypothetical protein